MKDQDNLQTKQDLINQLNKITIKPKIKLLMLFIIFLFLFIFVVLYFYIRKDNPTKNKKEIMAPINKQNEEIETTQINRSDWKTYNNKNFYYSFSYPPNYLLFEFKNPRKNILQLTVIDNSKFDPNERKYFNFSVKKIVKLEDEIKAQKQYIKEHELVSLVNESRIAKDGLEGVQLDYEPMTGVHGLKPFTIIVLGYEDTSFLSSTIRDNFYTYILETNIDKITYSQDKPTIADEIFSTFKQLPKPPINTSDKIENFSLLPSNNLDKNTWKTYTNKTYGFTIKFPSNWSTETYIDDYGIDTLTLKGPTRWIDSRGNINYPRLNIGSFTIYSTSGSICSGNACDEIGTSTMTINGEKFTTPILRGGSIYQNNENSLFDFYRLDFFELNKIKSKPVVTAEFGTKEQGQEIIDILSTITY